MRITAPALLTLARTKERAEVLRFLREVRSVMLRSAGSALVDFRNVRTIYPCGGLLLLAEIDRISRLVGGMRKMRCRPAANEIVDQVLQQIGVYERFEHTSSKTATHESVVHWRQATGVKAQGSDAGEMLNNCEGRLAAPLKSGLYRGITEAMTNSVQHAYRSERRDGVSKAGDKRWWLFSQERDGFLTVVICDLGIGIPASLPKEHKGMSKLIGLLGSDQADVGAIRLAAELGKTRTAEPNRGKGLPEILAVASESDQGSCVIYSNRGQFGFSSGGRPVENQFTDSNIRDADRVACTDRGRRNRCLTRRST